jgi:ATP-dependent exoDNAse (exonuclease V) alpha subunit
MTQSEALDILKMGKNVFLTGAAGSGKTFVINQYVNYLKKNSIDVAVTASTGIAATHIGGQTIHSWSGLGVRDRLTDYDIDELMQRAYLYKRFSKTKVLIIDEVSMLHGFRLDMIEWICRQFKRNEKPFGGIQIILCGDFFQLPPVNRGEILGEANNDFSFKSNAWNDSGFTVCYLTEQHRQKDNEFLNILNEIRDNNVSSKTKKLLHSRLNAELDNDLVPTRIFTHNIDVDIINHKYLDLISGEQRNYEMHTKGRGLLVETLKKSCLSPENLILKVGARVMFTKNDFEAGRYVNGTLGIVEGFNSFGDPEVRTILGNNLVEVHPSSWTIEEEGKVKAELNQLPLRLAWAITVHKSQGMSLDAIEVDLGKSFVTGMGYVALSRVRSLSGMKLLGLNDLALEVDEEVLKYDKKFKELSIDAVVALASMNKKEILEMQNEFLERVQPEEKKKIKSEIEYLYENKPSKISSKSKKPKKKFAKRVFW